MEPAVERLGRRLLGPVFFGFDIQGAEGKVESEGAASTQPLALGNNPAAEQPGDFPADRKAQARSLRYFGFCGAVRLLKASKIIAIFSGAIPIPVSFTTKAIASSICLKWVP